MDFNELRIAARRARHAALSTCVHYASPKTGVTSDKLRVKVYDKEDIVGELKRDGYAQGPAVISHLRFSSDELDQESITLNRGDRVTMPDGAVLILGALMPSDGPVNVVWQVAQA